MKINTLGGIILTVVVAVGVGYAIFNGEGWERAEEQEKKGEEMMAGEEMAGKSPKEVYLNYVREVAGVDNFEDFKALSIKYGSEEVKKQIAESEEQMEENPEGIEMIFQMVKEAMVPEEEMVEIEETVEGEMAMITITTINPEVNGVVTMVKEEGVWRIEKESWKESSTQEIEIDAEL